MGAGGQAAQPTGGPGWKRRRSGGTRVMRPPRDTTMTEKLAPFPLTCSMHPPPPRREMSMRLCPTHRPRCLLHPPLPAPAPPACPSARPVGISVLRHNHPWRLYLSARTLRLCQLCGAPPPLLRRPSCKERQRCCRHAPPVKVHHISPKQPFAGRVRHGPQRRRGVRHGADERRGALVGGLAHGLKVCHVRVDVGVLGGTQLVGGRPRVVGAAGKGGRDGAGLDLSWTKPREQAYGKTLSQDKSSVVWSVAERGGDDANGVGTLWALPLPPSARTTGSSQRARAQ